MNTANKLITHKRPILLGNCRNLFLLLSKNIKRRTAPLASHAALDAERASAGREKADDTQGNMFMGFFGNRDNNSDYNRNKETNERTVWCRIIERSSHEVFFIPNE